jgi:hypothetical protein
MMHWSFLMITGQFCLLLAVIALGVVTCWGMAGAVPETTSQTSR